jgi:two-component system cell cycle response regulator
MQQAGRRILVVDGSEVTRTIIARTLRDSLPQADILTCGTVAGARALLDHERFDLISTALMLPDQDGLQLSRFVRRTPPHHYTPIVVVSGDADSRLLREGFAAGVTDYFDKALGHEAFAEFISGFIERNSGLVGRILYVEDSPTAAASTRAMMERHGLQVVHTPSAEEALELLRRTAAGGVDTHRAFDVVVTDFQLKGEMTGGDLLHAVRARFRYSQQEMPVLMITASENRDRQVDVFHAGANDFVTKPLVEEILLARIRSLLLIKQQFLALKRQSETMHRLAITDTLTQVHNKRYLLDHGEAFLTDPDHHPVCAMLLDIDHFKRINDNFGHIAGDRVLEALGKLLRTRLPEGAMAVRFGGEEFALLLPRCDARRGRACGERLRREIERLYPAGMPVTVSIGLAGDDQHPVQGLTELLALADRALYVAKHQGRNRVCT